MLGICKEVADFLVDADTRIKTEIGEIRKAARLCGKCQQAVQTHVSEAYSPARVTGMADNVGLVPGVSDGSYRVRRVR